LFERSSLDSGSFLLPCTRWVVRNIHSNYCCLYFFLIWTQKRYAMLTDFMFTPKLYKTYTGIRRDDVSFSLKYFFNYNLFCKYRVIVNDHILSIENDQFLLLWNRFFFHILSVHRFSNELNKWIRYFTSNLGNFLVEDKCIHSNVMLNNFFSNPSQDITYFQRKISRSGEGYHPFTSTTTNTQLNISTQAKFFYPSVRPCCRLTVSITDV